MKTLISMLYNMFLLFSLYNFSLSCITMYMTISHEEEIKICLSVCLSVCLSLYVYEYMQLGLYYTSSDFANHVEDSAVSTRATLIEIFRVRIWMKVTFWFDGEENIQFSTLFQKLYTHVYTLYTQFYFHFLNYIYTEVESKDNS